MASFRLKVGAALFDLPRSLCQLHRLDGWLKLTNRCDQYAVSRDPHGIRIQSDFTSSLHVADMFPWFGRMLFRRCLNNWKFQFSPPRHSANPEFTFIIPHRGIERLPQLLMTLNSIGALDGEVECIVVEQDSEKRISLPQNVTHLHAPFEENDDAWRKCFAFNRGAEVARGRILVLHDGDILVPADYLSRLRWHFQDQGHEVVYPQRFLFYLTRETTEQLMEGHLKQELLSSTPEVIKQNWTGGTLAILKEAYFRVGGFDEEFTGWTGEDREFYDRCQILNGWFFGYMPFVHLWHPPQAGRITPESRRQAWAFTKQKLAKDRVVRMCENRRRNFGNVQ